eukprot:NODE_210_length_3392_cov_7.762940.p1 GENE.NODE_210_length_3392_cov_7.762940~~NODE_210_length_3392_cov_7.762940.p1  ORF type:complete len:933 (-),score=390.45 NODE_210_length_3392_cov_7.762940:594-3008(-)
MIRQASAPELTMRPEVPKLSLPHGWERQLRDCFATPTRRAQSAYPPSPATTRGGSTTDDAACPLSPYPPSPAAASAAALGADVAPSPYPPSPASTRSGPSPRGPSGPSQFRQKAHYASPISSPRTAMRRTASTACLVEDADGESPANRLRREWLARFSRRLAEKQGRAIGDEWCAGLRTGGADQAIGVDRADARAAAELRSVEERAEIALASFSMRLDESEREAAAALELAAAQLEGAQEQLDVRSAQADAAGLQVAAAAVRYAALERMVEEQAMDAISQRSALEQRLREAERSAEAATAQLAEKSSGVEALSARLKDVEWRASEEVACLAKQLTAKEVAAARAQMDEAVLPRSLQNGVEADRGLDAERRTFAGTLATVSEEALRARKEAAATSEYLQRLERSSEAEIARLSGLIVTAERAAERATTEAECAWARLASGDVQPDVQTLLADAAKQTAVERAAERAEFLEEIKVRDMQTDALTCYAQAQVEDCEECMAAEVRMMALELTEQSRTVDATALRESRLAAELVDHRAQSAAALSRAMMRAVAEKEQAAERAADVAEETVRFELECTQMGEAMAALAERYSDLEGARAAEQLECMECSQLRCSVQELAARVNTEAAEVRTLQHLHSTLTRDLEEERLRTELEEARLAESQQEASLRLRGVEQRAEAEVARLNVRLTARDVKTRLHHAHLSAEAATESGDDAAPPGSVAARAQAALEMVRGMVEAHVEAESSSCYDSPTNETVRRAALDARIEGARLQMERLAEKAREATGQATTTLLGLEQDNSAELARLSAHLAKGAD